MQADLPNFSCLSANSLTSTSLPSTRVVYQLSY